VETKNVPQLVKDWKRQQTELKPRATLSDEVMERLWLQMATLYGRKWESSCGLLHGHEYKLWSEGLAHFSLAQIKRGLDSLESRDDKFPPGLLEFRKLCWDNRINADMYLTDEQKSRLLTNDTGATHAVASKSLQQMREMYDMADKPAQERARKVPPMKNGKQIKLQRDRQAENWLKANT